MSASFHDGRVVIHHGDCLDVLDTFEANSFDGCVCDPPYHLASIVRRFGGEASAVAKHGTDGAFARASRGFMGKQWDGGDIAFRPETWAKVLRLLKPGAYIIAFSSSRTFGRMSVAIEDAGFITHPMLGWIFGSGFPKATRIKAEGFEGQRYGAQSLKPALEPIYMGQKPFSEATGTANILKWGTGAVNIDACRVEGTKTAAPVGHFRGSDIGASGLRGIRDGSSDNLGRWPANLIHDGSDEVLAGFPDSDVAPSGPIRGALGYGGGKAYEVERRSGSSGSAARFFYQAKADADDRLNSKHPTVKPLDLMRWLVRLVVPKGGVVLDPFAGTGSTGHAALIEGMRAILIERETEYCADIARRMDLVFAGRDERGRKLAVRDDSAMPLFGGAA